MCMYVYMCYLHTLIWQQGHLNDQIPYYLINKQSVITCARVMKEWKSLNEMFAATGFTPGRCLTGVECQSYACITHITGLCSKEYRSEERRVGKECRSEWWADQQKKK